MNRLQKYYQHVVLYDLLFKDHYINFMELPQLSHISLNTGLGLKAILDKKQILTSLFNMELVSHQRPIITRAKKSIDKFKLRAQMPVGCQVTLRRNNLYEFFDRFINIIIPYADDSNVMFNHSCYLSYLIKQKELKNIGSSFDLNYLSFLDASNNLSFQENSEIKTILSSVSVFGSNLNKNSILKPYFVSKSNLNYFNLPIQLLRDKFWFENKISNFPKKFMFSPKGLYYFFCHFNFSEKSFLSCHSWIFSSFPSSRPLNFNTSFSLVSAKPFERRSNFFYTSLAFGFQDFISSTSFGTVFNCGQLDISYGFDIIFVIRYLKNKRISQPNYFFSSFQMPFWLSKGA